MGHTVGERSWKNVVFCVFSVAAMESILRLAVSAIVFRSGCSASEGAGV
jgi:hypothetical protein